PGAFDRFLTDGLARVYRFRANVLAGVDGLFTDALRLVDSLCADLLARVDRLLSGVLGLLLRRARYVLGFIGNKAGGVGDSLTGRFKHVIVSIHIALFAFRGSGAHGALARTRGNYYSRNARIVFEDSRIGAGAGGIDACRDFG